MWPFPKSRATRANRALSETVTILWTTPGGFTQFVEADSQEAFEEIVSIEAGIASIVAEEGGKVLNAFNSSYCASFSTAPAAYRAATRIISNKFGTVLPTIPMICGLHCGQLYYHHNRAFGSSVGTAARICSLGHNRQIVLSDSVVSLVRPHLQKGSAIKSLGKMRDLRDVFVIVDETDLAREQKSAFISYRRDTGAELGRLVAGELRKLGIDTFIDLDDLKSAHFDDQIYRRIEETPNFILILSPGALDRCHEDGDWLCREIDHALQTDRNIIPILMPKFSMPDARNLPDAISELPRINGVLYSHDYSQAALAKVASFLKHSL